MQGIQIGEKVVACFCVVKNSEGMIDVLLIHQGLVYL